MLAAQSIDVPCWVRFHDELQDSLVESHGLDLISQAIMRGQQAGSGIHALPCKLTVMQNFVRNALHPMGVKHSAFAAADQFIFALMREGLGAG